MIRLIKFNDENFPNNLRKIKNAPKQIWTNGNIELLNTKSIAIVGSRHCTEYGKKWCEIFTKGLLEYDLTIVSGMAIGIDTVAHETALKYGGKTIAVLPCGFNNIYPERNDDLYEKIIENGGLVISEEPPNDTAEQEKFLKRNRIVSGLCIGTLVVEAAYRSGTSVTARFSEEQGKLVFCVPGSLNNSKSLGTNLLIQKGAKLVTCVNDITECYNLEKKIDIREFEKDLEMEDDEKNQDILDEIEEEYREIYRLISEKPMGINQISKLLKIPVNEVMSKATMLELDGKIERGVGDVFFKKDFLKYQKVPKKSAKVRKSPQSTEKVRKSPQSTEKIRKSPEKYNEIKKNPYTVTLKTEVDMEKELNLYGNHATNLILKYITEKGKVSKKYIRQNLNLTEGQVKYALRTLKAIDKIEKIGKGKESYYMIKESEESENE